MDHKKSFTFLGILSFHTRLTKGMAGVKVLLALFKKTDLVIKVLEASIIHLRQSGLSRGVQ